MSAQDKPKGRPSWVAGKIVANLDQRRKDMFDELIARYRETEPRTSQTNVIEKAIDLLYGVTITGKPE